MDHALWANARIVVIPCAINGHATKCMLDTGFGSGVMINATLAARLGIEPSSDAKFDWFGRPNAEAQLAAVTVNIGTRGAKASAVMSDYWGTPDYAIVGLGVISHIGAAMTIDTQRETVSFSDVPAAPASPGGQH